MSFDPQLDLVNTCSRVVGQWGVDCSSIIWFANSRYTEIGCAQFDVDYPVGYQAVLGTLNKHIEVHTQNTPNSLLVLISLLYAVKASPHVLKSKTNTKLLS